MKVTVVGAGLVGAATAYRLARRGVAVSLVDARVEGRATAAGAGMLPALDHFSAAPAMLPLLRAARAHYAELLELLADDGQSESGYRRVGALQLAFDEQELSALHDHRERARALEGFAHVGRVELLAPSQARELLPGLSPQLRGALHASGAARVDARALLGALLEALALRGGRRVSGEARLGWDGPRVVVEVPSGRLLADAVVIAAGAWSSALAAGVGLSLPVRAQRGRLVHLGLAGVDTGSWPLAVRSVTNYLVGFPGGRVVAGATREDGWGARRSELAVDGLRAQAQQLLPQLSGAALSEVRVGLRPVTPDGLPVLGAAESYPGLHFATGHGGYGIEVGPYSGALVADRLLAAGDGGAGRLDLAPFAPQRFSPGASAPV